MSALSKKPEVAPLAAAKTNLSRAARKWEAKAKKTTEAKLQLTKAQQDSGSISGLQSKLIRLDEETNRKKAGSYLDGVDPDLSELEAERDDLLKQLKAAQSLASSADAAIPVITRNFERASAEEAEAKAEHEKARQAWAKLRLGAVGVSIEQELNKLGGPIATLFAIEQLLPPPRFYDAFGIWEKTKAQEIFECFQRVGNEYDRPALPYKIRWLSPTANKTDLPGFDEAKEAIQAEVARIVSSTEEDEA